jgi:Lectin C-type domain
LASITSQSENDFVLTLFDASTLYTAWIGLTNRTASGFRWEGTGEAFSFENFCTEERMCVGEDDPEIVCAEFITSGAFWLKTDCRTETKFSC